MAHSWLAYLPPHLAADLLAHSGVSPLERVLRQQAVALFADISGFTPMSEALGQIGPRGTEELSQILNHTFGTMITLIHSYGGSIGKFAGDALTVVFPCQARNKQVTLRRALNCALEMQVAIGRMGEYQTSAGNFRLTMKIGIGMGSLLTTTVGDPNIRLEYLLAGSAIDRCAEAEQHAPQGAVVVADNLLPLLNIRTAVPVTAGYSWIMQLQRRPREAPPMGTSLFDGPVLATIMRYLPPSIAERLAQQQQGLVDEHRMVTTMFVRFTGFDYQDPQVLPELQDYLREVVQISDRYGGYLRQVDVGDKGSLYIVLFGAPLAHEDDAERALLCALEVRAAAQQLGITTASGITTGRVFCGLLGSDVRREYAAIGDSVNLAARLMSAARPQQILVDDATQQRTRALFYWTPHPPLHVKGKTAPVPVAALDRTARRSTRRLPAPSYTLPMVGRQAELQHCFARLDQVLQRHGQIVAISAEAGMGKSRLVAELMRSSQSKQFTVFTSECLSYGTQTSYLVWHTLLRGLFDLASDMPLDVQRRRVQAVLEAIDSTLVERMPLLAVALNLPIPENELTRQLDAKLRKESLEQLIITCLRRWAQEQPLLLILEDCHWIDPLSDDLLFVLGERIGDIPLLLLLTYRPFTIERTDTQLSGLRVRTLPCCQTLALAEFSREETAELIQLKLAQLFNMGEDAPAALVERIAERAQGNPFYIDELLNLLHDRGINPCDADALLQVELPDSLQRLILSRIDRLEEGPKTVLKLSSVIGRLFKAHWLWGIAPSLGTTTTVQEHLQLLQERELTQLERVEPEVEYLFKHLITRDVAYESLSLATRMLLHDQVGAYIEETYADELERWLDVLAYHYGLSLNHAKQRYYFRRAGDAAKAAFATHAAIAYYERLLPLVEEAEQAAVWLELAGQQTEIGDWKAAEQSAQAALALAEQIDHRPLIARSLYALGYRFSQSGLYAQARPFLARAQEQFAMLDDPGALADTLRVTGETYSFQGDQTTALRLFEEGLQIATMVHDRLRMSFLLMSIGTTHYFRNDWGAARTYYEQGLAVAVELRHLPAIQSLQNNLANVLHMLGVHRDALVSYQQGLTLAQRLGFTPAISLIIGNMGHTYSVVGQYQDALACLQTSLLMDTKVSAMTLGWHLPQLGSCYAKLGYAIEAQQLFARGLAVCRALKMETPLAAHLYEYAVWQIYQHNLEQALSDVTEAHQLAERLEYKELELNSHLLRVYLEVVLEKTPIATALARLEQLCSSWTAPHQQAAIAYMVWRIDPSQETARVAAAAHYRSLFTASPNHEYRERYAELSGQHLPDPPPLPPPPEMVSFAPVPIDTLLALADPILAAPS